MYNPKFADFTTKYSVVFCTLEKNILWQKCFFLNVLEKRNNEQLLVHSNAIVSFFVCMFVVVKPVVSESNRKKLNENEGFAEHHVICL